MFRTAGVFPYTCYLHPGMNGAVVVGGVDAPKLESGSDPLSDSSLTADAAPNAGTTLAARTAAVPTSSSAGPWRATTAAGFGLAFVLGLVLLLQWRHGRRVTGEPS
ncbi:MAG: hypothetical protein ABR518_10245 [Actinomycetota bacterium]